MNISKVDVTGELRVTYDPGSGEVWDKKINLMSVQKAKILSDFHELNWFLFPNGENFGANISEDLAINSVSLGVGDAAATNFTGTVGPLPIKASSVTITDGTQTITDDGAGNLVGDIGAGVNTVNYTTGAINTDFVAAPIDNAAVTVDFTRGIASDDSLTTGFVFEVTEDAAPALDDTEFTTTVPLAVTPKIVDRYESDTYIHYLVEMTASYAGADTTAITALAIKYKTVTGNGAGVAGDDKILAKSTAMADNIIWATDAVPTNTDLLLKATSTITVTYRVKVAK